MAGWALWALVPFWGWFAFGIWFAGFTHQSYLCFELEYSLKVSTPFIKQVMEQNNSCSYDVLTEQMSAPGDPPLILTGLLYTTEHATIVRAQLPTNMQYAMDLGTGEGGFEHGLLLFRFKSTSSPCIKELSGMPLHCATVGNPLVLLPNAHVAPLSQLTMHSPVQKEVFS